MERVASERQWSRGDTVALANARCANCVSTGLRRGRGSKTSPCGCVLRNLFRAVLGRYQREGLRVLCARSWRKWSTAAEFRGDVFLVSLGHLTEQEQVIFREFFLADKPWYAVVQTIQRGVPKCDVPAPEAARKGKWWLTLRVNREREHGV